MANFIKIDDNQYKIEGLLTSEDIIKINSFKNRTTLILDNTKGLSSEIIDAIKSDRIVFSIKGGLDYDSKEKYKEQKYIDRTFVSPSGLRNIIRYFEHNEKMIDPEWNEFEKAMFLYNSLVVDMEYEEDYEHIQSAGTTERSLNGILYGKLVCAGFAQAYKEMLDRVGIQNYYQNQKDVHAFNILEIDGKKYGVDVTWDNNAKNNNNGKCGFYKFARDPDFYTRHGHQLYKEELEIGKNFEDLVIKKLYDIDEEIFDLSVADEDDLNKYYDNIKQAIDSRKSFKYDLQNQSIYTKNKYLPVNIVEYRLKQEANDEYPVVIMMDFLKNNNALTIDDELVNAFQSRKGYLLDIVKSGDKYLYDNFNMSEIGMENYEINRDGRSRYFENLQDTEKEQIYIKMNKYLNDYLNQYSLDTIKNLDNLLNCFEYEPNDFDMDRFIENANIYSKLSLITNSRNHLIKLGIDEHKIDEVISRINNKKQEIYHSDEIEKTQQDYDLDFVSGIFSDMGVSRQVIEQDLQRKVSDEEFASLYQNADYISELFNKYVTIGENKKFDINDYDIDKEQLKEILKNNIIEFLNKNMDDNNYENLNDMPEQDNHNKSR